MHRTIRRRSLVFERAESHKRKSICDSIQSNNKAATSDDKLVQSGYSFSKLPGIGLHLNTLASTNDGLVSNENWASESQLISTPRIMKPGSSLALAEVPPDNLERALVPWDGETQVTETTYQTSEYLVGEELKHTSPRNKRHVRNTSFLYSTFMFSVLDLVFCFDVSHLAGVSPNKLEKTWLASAVTVRGQNA